MKFMVVEDVFDYFVFWIFKFVCYMVFFCNVNNILKLNRKWELLF